MRMFKIKPLNIIADFIKENASRTEARKIKRGENVKSERKRGKKAKKRKKKTKEKEKERRKEKAKERKHSKREAN